MSANTPHGPTGLIWEPCTCPTPHHCVEATGGEQGPTAVESELFAARDRVRELEAERNRLKEELDARKEWGAIIHESWGAGDFYGPCAHGRDPYTRCDECEPLSPRKALEKSIRLPLLSALADLVAEVDRGPIQARGPALARARALVRGGR